MDLELHPVQAEAFMSPATELLFGGAAGGGKALALGTLVPTPEGWSTMGELVVGDELFGADGHPCRVVAVTESMHNHACYRVDFCDGQSIVADAGHLWRAYSDSDREALRRRTDEFRGARRAKRKLRGTGARPDLAEANSLRKHTLRERPAGRVVSTEHMAGSVMKGPRHNWSVEMCPGLRTPDAELPIPPYALGVWLGDGTRGQGAITTADAQIVEELEREGYEMRKRPAHRYGWGVVGLQRQLGDLGVLHEKHIPLLYLRASEEQRMDLLRGLMDTDGTVNKSGQCEFDNCNLVLMQGVHDLVSSLGIKARISEGVARLNGKDCGPKYRIKFTTAKQVFRLQRKRVGFQLSKEAHKRGGWCAAYPLWTACRCVASKLILRMECFWPGRAWCQRITAIYYA